MELPDNWAHVWGWFVELQSFDLDFTEIEAWSRLTRVTVTPEEVRLLMSLQAESRSWWAERNKRKKT